MTRSLFMGGTVGSISIINTSEISYLVKGTPETIVTLRMVLIVWRITLSKEACLVLSSLLSETKKDL